MRIYDGRDSFYQWDSNQKVVHNFKVGDEVHFFNMRQPTALTVRAYQLNNEVVADVPNILLQSSYPIYIYWMNLNDNGQFTKEEFTVNVNQRPKPSGYIYTETEVLSYEYLDARISEIEQNGVSSEQISSAVGDYLEKNPITGGASPEEIALIHQNKQDIEKLSTNKLDADELPTAVNEALAQAKASGEFDGADGTPGKDGTDGVSATHKWSGTVLTVTSASGTSSADLKGEPGKDGEPGQPGADGKDYVLTEADKQEIAEQAAGMVEPYAPDLTGYATEAYVDETAEALRGEIPVTQIEYLAHLPEFISTHSVILVSRTSHNPTGTNWTGTLIVTRGYFNYGVYDFSAIDGAGACYQGAVNLRDNSINLTLVDSLESKATKEYVDEAVGNVDIPTALPNPNALTFTGAATGTYDGSAPLTVNIPEGGGGGTGGGSSGTWELIGEVTSDGAGNSNGIYVPIDFTQYKEVFIEAWIAANVIHRVLMSSSTAWYNGQILNTNSTVGGDFGGTSNPRNENVLAQTIIHNICGELKPFSSWCSGYAGGGKSVLQVSHARTTYLATSYSYIRMDTNNNGAVAEGNWLKVWGCK